MMKKTNNKNELLGMIYRYIYRRRGLTPLERELILQGAKYVIKHLPKDDTRFEDYWNNQNQNTNH